MTSAFEKRVAQCSYSGRGMVMGTSADGRKLLQLYWIMGRSENSRNRIFCAEGHELWTEAADPAKLTDPSLIIYTCMSEVGSNYSVSNGDQTKSIAESLQRGGSFHAALAAREREPDAPHYTPRISGMIHLDRGRSLFSFSVLRANRWDQRKSDRFFFEIDSIAAGVGLALTTYEGDGNPLPSFSGEPLEMPLVKQGRELLEQYWQALDKNNRVSLALKEIDIASGKSQIEVINNY